MDEKPELVCVDPARIEELWPHIAPLIDDAYARFGSRDERRKVEEDIRAGLALVWLAWSPKRQIEAALVTDLIREDDVLICRLRALAGEQVTRWLSLVAQIEAYAKAEKCSRTRYIGRPGWKAMLKDYRVTHVQAEKLLK